MLTLAFEILQDELAFNEDELHPKPRSRTSTLERADSDDILESLLHSSARQWPIR